jgi:two-component sensor histidine kinase
MNKQMGRNVNLSQVFPRLAWKENWEINISFINVIFLLTLLPAVFSASRGIKAPRIYLISLIEKGFLWVVFILIIILCKKLIGVFNKGKSSLFSVLVIGFCAGLTIGTLDVKLQKLLGLTMQEVYPISLTLSFALTAALWLPVGSALTYGPKELRRRKKLIFAESEKIHRVQIRQSIALSAIQERINQVLRNRLQSTAAGLKEDSPRFNLFEKKQDLALYLSKEIAHWNLSAIRTMRELSHQISYSEPLNPKSLRATIKRNLKRINLIVETFSTSLALKPISPYLYTAMIGSVIAYPVLREQEMQSGLLRFAYVITYIFIISFGVFVIRKTVARTLWQIDLLGLTAIMALPWLIPVFSTVGNSISTTHYKNLIFDALIIFIFIVIHIAQSYQISGEELLENLDKRNSENLAKEKMVSEQIGILTREWAEHIHGRVITRLASASMLLEQVESRGDSAAIISALDIIADVLSESNLTDSPNQKHETLAEELNFRVDPWKGILDIQLNLDPKSSIVKSDRLAEIGLLVEEAISNSVRHGKSSQVEIKTLPPELNKLTILIRDNSEVPIAADLEIHESAGMGTKIYDAVTDGNWTLRNDSINKGTALWAEISLV